MADTIWTKILKALAKGTLVVVFVIGLMMVLAKFLPGTLTFSLSAFDVMNPLAWIGTILGLLALGTLTGPIMKVIDEVL